MHGLARVRGDTLVQLADLKGPSLPTAQLLGDSKGRIWIAQPNRVSVYANGTLTRFESAEGISGFTYALYEDSEGFIWASTADGLSRFEGDRFRTLNAKQGIPSSNVFGAVKDALGAWWLAARPGILRVAPGEIERALADPNHQLQFRTFDEADGTGGVLVKGYWGPVLTGTADGRIWVATDSGIASIDARRLSAPVPPRVNIEVMRIQGREQLASDNARIPAGTSDLEIDYTSLSLATPQRIQFRYRLDGADTTWREVGSRRRAYYTGLAPGSYRFQVTASYGDGNWNTAGASWGFRVLPMWYQTLWFKALVVIAIAGLGAGAAVWVQRRRHDREQRSLTLKYEATLAERARIAQDLHDTLMQGFAGVTLQMRAVELSLPDRPEVTAQLGQIRELARESLREARERVWEMRDSHLGGDDLPAALEAMARARTTGTSIEVTVIATDQGVRLSRSLEDAAFRVAREAVVNAVRHADARRIELRLDVSPAMLRLEIRDDGKGFTQATGEQARRDGHFGLSGMRERAEQIGGRCVITSGPQGGTSVVLELPLPQPA